MLTIRDGALTLRLVALFIVVCFPNIRAKQILRSIAAFKNKQKLKVIKEGWNYIPKQVTGEDFGQGSIILLTFLNSAVQK